MDGFAVVVLGGGLAILAVLLILGGRSTRTSADILDWKPTRSIETEIQLELEDVQQMIDAQNERRRRSGRPDIDESKLRAEVVAAERDQAARRAAYRAQSDQD